MRAYIPIAFAITLIFAGCVPPVEPTPPMKRDHFESPLVPSPPLPKVAPDANSVSGPKPGQADDHANPAFKSGGVLEPKN